MQIETERMILRPWQESDAESLYRYAQDPEVGPAAGWQPHTSVENSREIIRGVLSDAGDFAITLKGVDEAIGSISIMRKGHGSAPIQDDEAELGYWIGKPYWGQGLVPEAVNALLGCCFTKLDCRGVWCAYYEGNEKSRRVQEKCGFVERCRAEVFCAPMNERRMEIFNYIARDRWEEMRGR